MKNRGFIAVLLLLTGAALFGFSRADDDIIKKAAEQLARWTDDYPQEKVHLHLDKPFYAIGEDIWFKAYVTIGPEHHPSTLSNILNVELINDKGTVQQSVKVPLISGVGWADFALADSLTEGNYRLRAYTNWMRNAGEDYFYDKALTIVNAISNKVFTQTNYTYSTVNGVQKVNAVITYTDINGQPYAAKEVSYQVQSDARNITKGKGVTDGKGNLTISFTNTVPALFKAGRLVTVINVDKEKITKTIPVKAASDNIDVQFFPESGYLVNGIASKVAFKAIGADGLGKEVKGVVKDEQGNTVAAIASQHLGMGQFMLDPQAGKSYKASITYADGSEKVFELPKAKESGYVLNIDNSNPAAVVIKLQATGNAEVVSLVAQQSGKICYAAKSKAGVSGFTSAIPKTRFASGIVQFTLFSATGEPLNERLIFIQKNDLLKLDLTTAKQSYATREKVKLNINSKNGRDSLIEGSFSVSVTDETKVKVDEDDESTILSDILLTSDLKGYIEKPAYYFNNVSDKTRADMDVLMLTQGYRRFEWKQLMSNTFLPPVYQPEKTLSVSGTVTYKGKPFAGAKVLLFARTQGVFTTDTIADTNGNFSFDNLVFADSARIAIQASTFNGKKENVDIVLNNIDPQRITKNKNAPGVLVNINAGLTSYIQSSKKLYDEQLRTGVVTKTIELKEVVITEKKQVVKSSANLNGPGNADQILTAKDLMIGCSSLMICLQGRLTGVIFRNGMPYSTRNAGNGPPMQVILDGMQMEADFLSSLNANDVESIEVLRDISKTAVYGSRGYGGVLVITTKRGESSYNRLTKADGIVTYTPKGYYVARTFYSPVYGDPKTKESVADMRTTIYWTPNIITDKQGNASVEYYNAGSKGTYRVVIEGIDNDGNIGRQVYRYKVE